MNRREFIKSLALLPALPLLNSLSKFFDVKEDVAEIKIPIQSKNDNVLCIKYLDEACNKIINSDNHQFTYRGIPLISTEYLGNNNFLIINDLQLKHIKEDVLYCKFDKPIIISNGDTLKINFKINSSDGG